MAAHLLAFAVSVFVLAIVLWDAFETVILPRTVTGRLRLTRLYFGVGWRIWTWIGRTICPDARRERFLATFGPLSLLALIAGWAIGLVIGFGGLQWALGSHVRPLTTRTAILDDLYMSGSTFFTLGLGDVQPVGWIARSITVAEAGTGFAFLAIVIAYFPVLYQSFSRRETQLTLLDTWAGSPPTAVEALRRLATANELATLQPFLQEWERWCSDILESHISYPAIAFFRSQHQRQSWVAALAAILDLSALVEVGIDGVPPWQAHLTFAMARHAAVDLTQVLRTEPDLNADRLPPGELEALRRQLERVGLVLKRSPEADAQLIHLRRSYEPYICGLARALMMPLPPWAHDPALRDNWQTDPKGLGDAHL
jgi:hypothetical protein